MRPLPLTPSQTIGPFFHALVRDDHRVLVSDATLGERIRLEGRVFDNDGAIVPDALIEIWQANAAGRYDHSADRSDAPLDPAFHGFGRAATDDDGIYWFETIKPGAVAFTGTQRQAPHINLTIHARGLLNHLSTRAYFADEPATATDPILDLVPEHRRATLIAKRENSANGVTYRLDIILSGTGETVFLDF
ncbi:MAG: protocatechuate 3,4-dioxygenase subunit alpha [Chloroflexota bacterium]